MNDKKYLINILLLIIITTLAYLPLLKEINAMITSDRDWSYFTFFASAYRRTVIEFNQLPLRTHLLGGGYPLIAYPRDWALNPSSLFILAFGEVAGLRIITFLLFVLGGVGMFYLTKNVLEYNYPAALFSSSLYLLSTWAAWHVVRGNVIICFSYLIPWPLAFYLKSIKDKKFIIFSSLALSVIFTIGSLIVFPVVLFLFLFALLHTIKVSRKFHITFSPNYFRYFIILIIITLLFSAAKVIPMYNLLQSRTDPYFHNPPEERTYEAVVGGASKHFFDIQRFKSALLDKDYSGRLKIYFGYIPILFIFLSLFAYPKETFRYLMLLLFFTVVMFGPCSRIDIFKTMWHMHPSIRAIVDPDRYFLSIIILLMCLLSARALLLLSKIKKLKLLSSFFTGIVVCFVVHEMFQQHSSIMQKIGYKKIPPIESSSLTPESFFQVKFHDPVSDLIDAGKLPADDYSRIIKIKDYTKFHPLIRQNIGITSFCYTANLKITEFAIPRYIIDKGNYSYVFSNIYQFRSIAKSLQVNPSYKGEAFFLNSEENTAESTFFSPNRIEVDIELKTPDKLVINQNYHKSWASDKGMLTNYKGLLAVELKEQGNYTVKLNYVPLDFYTGAVVSLLTFIGMGTYLTLTKKGTFRENKM